MTLLAAAAWAAYVAFGATLLRRHSPLKTTSWAIVGGLCVMAPFGLIPLIGFDFASVPPGAWLLLLFSSIVSVAVANVVTLHGVRLLGPTRVTSYQFLTPFITLVLAALLLSEPILPGQVVGGLVIGLGILIARGDARRLAPCRRGRRQRRARRDEPRTVTRPVFAADGAPVSFLVDYDGTISSVDVGDALMDRFVADRATVAAKDADYDAGRVGSRELMQWDMEVLPRDAELLRSTAAALPHDDGLPGVRGRRRGQRRGHRDRQRRARLLRRVEPADGWRRRWPTCPSRPTRTAWPAPTA